MTFLFPNLNDAATSLVAFLTQYRVPDLVTTLAAVALLFVASDFYKQHKMFPKRKYIGLLAIFFLLDGLDYTTFVLSQGESPFFELLGIICDAGVAITAMIAMFGTRELSKDRDKTDPPSAK